MEYDKRLVENYWSKTECSASDKNFYCFPPIRSRSCKLIFDEYDATRRDWCEYWTVEKYLKDKVPFEKCLSICCGFGEVERILSKLNVAKTIIGIDIAQGAVTGATERAKAEGFNNIKYYVMDLNSEELPEMDYDIIWANGALHHLKDLDVVIPKLRKALKTSGYLISNEYVGPRYQQIGKRQQEIINAAKYLLPRDLRENKLYYNFGMFGKYRYGQSIQAKVIQKAMRYIEEKLEHSTPNVYGRLCEIPPVEHFLNTDPSESVSSDKIIPLLKKYFDDVEVKYFHGSILLYALDQTFYDNFNFNNEKHRSILELLFVIEDVLIAVGEIPSDNAHVICKKE